MDGDRRAFKHKFLANLVFQVAHIREVAERGLFAENHKGGTACLGLLGGVDPEVPALSGDWLAEDSFLNQPIEDASGHTRLPVFNRPNNGVHDSFQPFFVDG